MGHVIFALDTVQFIKINDVYGNLKDRIKLDLCLCDALNYMQDRYHGDRICGHDYQLGIRMCIVCLTPSMWKFETAKLKAW